jgi:hypothetical protein
MEKEADFRLTEFSKAIKYIPKKVYSSVASLFRKRRQSE